LRAALVEAEKDAETLQASNNTYERDWPQLVHERSRWRECAERLIEYAHESLTNLGTWGNGYERYERQMEQIRADIAQFDRLKGETK